MTFHNCYVIDSKANSPVHLKDRRGEVFEDTSILFRFPEDECLDPDGRVKMPGAVEFRTSIGPSALAIVCDPTEMWREDLHEAERFRAVYDPQIQRGEKEAKGGKPTPILKEENIKSMIEDIEKNEFECPELMWNLRFGTVLWVYMRELRELRVYEGVATRPDTNHRHHAIIRTHRQMKKFQNETGAFPQNYNPARKYALAIYADDFQGEAHKFFVLNSKGQKVAKGKAYYVESMTNDPHVHSRLARELMYGSGVLGDKNTEIVQSTISKNSVKMVLFYTLVRGLQQAIPALPEPETSDYVALRKYLVDFVGELSSARPNEIAVLSLDKRQKSRSETIADQAITWIALLKARGTAPA